VVSILREGGFLKRLWAVAPDAVPGEERTSVNNQGAVHFSTQRQILTFSPETLKKAEQSWVTMNQFERGGTLNNKVFRIIANFSITILLTAHRSLANLIHLILN
jgi:hypothetical protein